MSRPLYPYDTIGNGIKLTVQIDGKSVERWPHQVSKTESKMRVATTALLPSKWKDMFCSIERVDPPVGVGLEILHIAGRNRSTRLMNQIKRNTFELSFELAPAEQIGVVELHATVYRKTEASNPELGKAVDKGARVAWSETGRMVFDERAPRSGETLNIVWTNFEEETDVKGHFGGSMYCLDLKSTNPTLHLNRGSDYLQVLFDAKDGTKHAKERDILYAQIATSVWPELIANALLDLQATSEDPEMPPEMENITEWQQKVLNDWTPRLFPDIPDEDSSSHMLERLLDDEFFKELVGVRLPMAVQQHTNLRDELEKFANRVLTDG